MMSIHAHLHVRDFTDEDYEALLELDSDVARPRLSEAMLSTLRTHVHSKGAAQGKAGCGAPVPCAPGQTSSLADKVLLPVAYACILSLYLLGCCSTLINALQAGAHASTLFVRSIAVQEVVSMMLW